MTHLTYLEAGVVGLVQGISEMFPVSSLGHNVLIPALIGGSWAKDLNVAAPESPYLAFIVGLHVATAIALVIYFWRDWVRIVGGFFSSLRERRVQTADQRMAWLIILATIPVGLVGLAFEHAFRVIFGKPVLAAVFLVVNGVILIAGERYRTRASLAADAALREARARAVAATAPAQPLHPVPAAAPAGLPAAPARYERDDPDGAVQADRRLAAMGYPRALVIGSAQILALLAGISRDGVAMVAGMARGLQPGGRRPVRVPAGHPGDPGRGRAQGAGPGRPLGAGIRGQILFGSVLSGVGAYLSVRFLLRYLRTRTLTPFGVYCLIVGLASVAFLTLAR